MGKYGYAYSNVRAYPLINDTDKSVDLEFNIEPGSRIYVSQVLISGNTQTDDLVIRREIRQMDGTWLSNEAMDMSKRRLNRTGFFESVDMELGKAGSNADVVNINTTVKEQPTGSITGGIGFGTDSGIQLQASIQQSNLLGTGSRGVLSSYKNDYRTHFEIGYTDPYFTVDNVSLGGRIYYDSYDGDDDDVIDYKNKTIGLDVTLGYPLSETWRVEYGLGVKHSDVENTGERFVQAETFWEQYNGDPNDREGTFFNYSASFTMIRSTLDRGMFPTDGSKQVFSASVTIPGSDNQYYKLSAETYHYFPFDREHNFVLGFRGRAGYADGYGTKNGETERLPFFENFYLGSQEWLRGFDHNSVGPRACYEDITKDTAVGGNAFWTTSVEFFVPTPFVSEAYKNSLRTAFFFDMGSLWDTRDSDYYYYDGDRKGQKADDKSGAGKYRSSVGVAVTWLSPIGPLSLSLAKAIKTRDGDDTQTFNFNIGGSF